MSDKKRDKQILELKEKIQQKVDDLKASGKFKPKTNLILPLNNQRLNINVLDSDTLLLTIVSIATIKSTLESVGITDLPSLGGYSVEDWIHDLKGKFDLLNRKNEENRLKNMQSQLEELLSEGVKKDNKLEEILKSFS